MFTGLVLGMPSTKAPDSNGLGYEWEYAQPKDDHTPWERFKLAIYNPSTHDVFGRSVKSWGGIFLFYIIFYSLLAVFFTICMKILLSTLHSNYPRLQQEESIIGTNPGLGYRPMPEDPEHGSIIRFIARNQSNVENWTKKIDSFLNIYTNNHPNQMVCNYDSGPTAGKVCSVDVKQNMGPCAHNSGYQYNQSKPCVFLKLNKIYGWHPEFYDISNLPTEMPQNLKDNIRRSVGEKPSHAKTVWVTCDGEAPADREHIGPVKIYPQNGFPWFYYPYENRPGYVSPILAVHFENPKLNTLINVDCRAWAQNIVYKKSSVNREGSVHFELQID